jgi:hypothetical protein
LGNVVLDLARGGTATTPDALAHVDPHPVQPLDGFLSRFTGELPVQRRDFDHPEENRSGQATRRIDELTAIYRIVFMGRRHQSSPVSG